MAEVDVAVVGGGPRALFALERLASWVATGRGRVRRVDVYSGTGQLGTSEHYAPSLPEYARLNVLSSAVDVWEVGPTAAPWPAGAQRASLDQWRRSTGETGDLDPFPPRRMAGAYLSWAASVVLDLLTRVGVEVRVQHRMVSAIERSGDRWRLDPGSGYDEVLLASGHDAEWPGALKAPGVFPLSSLGSLVPVGAPVILRGAALTAIDAALAFTEGRGGSFADMGGGLRYCRAGDESVVTMVSRTGRLMAPKTPPGLLSAWGVGAHLVEEPARQIGCTDMPSLLADAVERISWVVGGPDRVSTDDVSEILFSDREEPLEGLRRGVAMASGVATPDARWALGQAWRLLYPALVAAQRQRGGETPVLGWEDYSLWSAELERLSFGPPLVNARKLLALAEGGLLDVVAGDAEAVAEARGATVLDAVIAPPGVPDGGGAPMVRNLMREGVISRSFQGRGIRVAADASCLDVDGLRVPGLAAVGRITEDVVMGNDTLTRTMHPQLDAWARRVTWCGEEMGE